jgi:phage-related protein
MLSSPLRWKVFYYQTERGDSPIEDFLAALPRKARAKCVAYMDMLEEFGFNLPRSVMAKVRGDLWELRPEWAGTEYRFLYFALVGRRFVILHAVTKKSQKLRSKDMEIAEARMMDVRRRVNHEGPSSIRQRAD